MIFTLEQKNTKILRAGTGSAAGVHADGRLLHLPCNDQLPDSNLVHVEIIDRELRV